MLHSAIFGENKAHEIALAEGISSADFSLHAFLLVPSFSFLVQLHSFLFFIVLVSNHKPACPWPPPGFRASREPAPWTPWSATQSSEKCTETEERERRKSLADVCSFFFVDGLGRHRPWASATAKITSLSVR
jgi:hypothetical protein